MKYNEYSYETIKKLIAEGQKYKKKGWNKEELCHYCYNENYGLNASRFVLIGYDNPDFIPGEIQEFYRIGEPQTDGNNCYLSSWNYADDRREDGVSVVTLSWLNSWKGLFFGTYDEKISKVGVYKIRGWLLPGVGGDGEPLICPMDWAEKTKIHTRKGLERAVKKINM